MRLCEDRRSLTDAKQDDIERSLAILLYLLKSIEDISPQYRVRGITTEYISMRTQDHRYPAAVCHQSLFRSGPIIGLPMVTVSLFPASFPISLISSLLFPLTPLLLTPHPLLVNILTSRPLQVVSGPAVIVPRCSSVLIHCVGKTLILSKPATIRTEAP